MAQFNLKKLQEKLKIATSKASKGDKKIVYNGSKVKKNIPKTSKGCGCGKK